MDGVKGRDPVYLTHHVQQVREKLIPAFQDTESRKRLIPDVGCDVTGHAFDPLEKEENESGR